MYAVYASCSRSGGGQKEGRYPITNEVLKYRGQAQLKYANSCYNSENIKLKLKHSFLFSRLTSHLKL